MHSILQTVLCAFNSARAYLPPPSLSGVNLPAWRAGGWILFGDQAWPFSLNFLWKSFRKKIFFLDDSWWIFFSSCLLTQLSHLGENHWSKRHYTHFFAVVLKVGLKCKIVCHAKKVNWQSKKSNLPLKSRRHYISIFEKWLCWLSMIYKNKKICFSP